MPNNVIKTALFSAVTQTYFSLSPCQTFLTSSVEETNQTHLF